MSFVPSARTRVDPNKVKEMHLQLSHSKVFDSDVQLLQRCRKSVVV